MSNFLSRTEAKRELCGNPLQERRENRPYEIDYIPKCEKKREKKVANVFFATQKEYTLFNFLIFLRFILVFLFFYLQTPFFEQKSCS